MKKKKFKIQLQTKQKNRNKQIGEQKKKEGPEARQETEACMLMDK